MKTAIILFTLNFLAVSVHAQDVYEYPGRNDLIVDFTGDSARKTAAVLQTDEGAMLRSYISCVSSTKCRLAIPKDTGQTGPMMYRNPYLDNNLCVYVIGVQGNSAQGHYYDALYGAMDRSRQNEESKMVYDLKFYMVGSDQKTVGKASWTLSNPMIGCEANCGGPFSDEAHFYTFKTIFKKDMKIIKNGTAR